MLIGLVKESGFLDGDVNQSRQWAIGHGVPAMAPQRSGSERDSLILSISCFHVLNRAARLQVNALSPGHRGIRLCGNHLARSPVEHIKESVFRSMEKHFSQRAGDR